ncbi:uncharacterized protein LOC122570257 [Bombus pyrosoma]|uniref:uncharacterized protein LOC122570257 n=1 Tax=Bombus pyrosoma TaxID=396416 RepID=UPI001CB96805|nr:uncharacterized protein LOC122570257 [Bombus pyrosoma]
MRVATTSSNLKGTFIKALKETVCFINAAWRIEAPRRMTSAGSSAESRLTESRMYALQEENAALRRELSRKAMSAFECPRCGGSEADRAPCEAASQSARLDALERKVDDLVPNIIRMMETSFGSLLSQQQQQHQQQQQRQRQSAVEAGRNADHSATRRPALVNPPPPLREQEGGEWRVVESRRSRSGRRRRIAEERLEPAEGEGEARNRAPVPAPRRRGAARASAAAAAAAATNNRKGPTTPAALPRTPRTSAVTLTLTEGANMSYADVVSTARRTIPLGEIGLQSVRMKKAVTGAIVIRVPGDKDREKASLLATRLAGVLDPSKVRVGALTIKGELRLLDIDISMEKEELRETLAKAAGCSSTEVQVGEIGTSRGGLGSAWIKCPAAAARKLAQAGKVALGWSIAKVIAIPKRPLQCFKCLELGHVRATCTSTVDRGHLCYRCGGSGHRARGCTASTPKCLLCESLGAPAGHRMGGAACAPPKVNNNSKRRRAARQQAAAGNEKAATTTATAATTIRENRVALAVVAEPYRVPDAPNWIGDLDGSTAVTWTPALSSPGALLERGNGYVAVEWNRIAVVGAYISPNSGVAAFEDFLDRAGDCVRRCFPRQVIVLGDFNAHSSQWGDARTDTRGRALTDWAAGLGLLLANKGTASTCVAWRGSSVVDVTWATADLYRRIRGWRVADRMETLSDHLYIMMEMELDGRRDANRSHRPPPPPPTPR